MATHLLRLIALFIIPTTISLLSATAEARQFARTRSTLWQNASGHNLAVHPQTGQILVAALDPRETAVVRTYSPDLSTSSERTFGQSSGFALSISSSGKFIDLVTMPSENLDFTFSLFDGRLSSEKPLAQRVIRDPEFPVNGLSIGDRDNAPTLLILNFQTKTISLENLFTRHQTSIPIADDLQLLRFYHSPQATSADFSLFAVGRTGPAWTDPGFDLYSLPALSKIDLDTQPLNNVSSINFAQHSRTLLVGDETGQIAAWDLQQPEPRRTCLIEPSELLAKHEVRQLALSKSGRCLAAELNGDLVIWNLPEGRHLTTLDRQNRDWTSFAWRDETLVTLANEAAQPHSKNTRIEFWELK